MSERMTLGQKLAYGAGDLGPAITANLQVFFFLPFLTGVAGLNPAVAGSILAISKIWDALTDPVIGILTDRTRSRWGRRRPWLLFGAIPFGLMFLAQWWIPFAGNPAALFWYYLLVAIIFSSCFSAVNLPYTALTPELTQDYDERTSLSNYRFAFSISGSLVSAVVHPLIVGQFPRDPALGYLVSGAIWAVLAVLPLFWCFWGTQERYHVESEPLPIVEQLKIALNNRAYLLVIGIYLCSWLAVQITATIIPYYITFRMGLPGSWISFTILGVQGTALVMLFVWNAVSQKLGKREVFFLGMGLWMVAQIGLLTLQPGQTILMLILAVMAGMGVAVAYLIPWSMLPDVIDLDEVTTGQRREGVFYSLMVLLQKVGLAAGLFLVGQALNWSGFVSTTSNPPPVQPESAILALRVMIGPVPLVILIVGVIFAWFYPLTRQKHQEVLDQLAQRRQQH